MIRAMSIQGAVLVAIAAAVPAARAIVVQIDAEARSEIFSVIGNPSPGLDCDSAFECDIATEVFGPDSGVELPIMTQASLETFDDAGETQALALAVAEFRDPTLNTTSRNPQELSLEADCGTNDDTGYSIRSFVVETRLVRLSAADLGNPIGATTVQSAFFPSGALVLWSTEANRDLTGLFAELNMVVRQVVLDASGNETDRIELLNETVAVRGGPGGSVEEEIAPAVFTIGGDVSVLPGLAVDDAATLEELAVLRILIIPEIPGLQQIAYEYEAVADQEFILEAEVTVTAASLPNGTGVVAVFGRTFDDAAAILETSIPQGTAKAFESQLNRAILEFDADTPTTTLQQQEPETPTSSGLCGILGFELLAMMALSLTFHWIPTSRGIRRD